MVGGTRLKTSQLPTLINLKLARDQLNINTNTVVAFVLKSASGLSVASNRVTLKATNTYVLFATMRHNGSAANTAANYSWRDFTNAVNLGIGSQVSSQDSLTDDGASPSMIIVIKPSTDIDVGVRCTGVSVANQGLFPDATQASIHSIP